MSHRTWAAALTAALRLTDAGALLSAPPLRPRGFRDASIPAGFAPFNIQHVQGNLYVTYAKQDKDKHDDVAGPGFFDAHSGEFLGRLRTPEGKLLRIDGLWALMFGNGFQNQPTSTLFFTAGPNSEADGLYGTLTPASGGRDDDHDDDD
jgi:hypothetical protein